MQITGFQTAKTASGLISDYKDSYFQQKLDGTRLQVFVFKDGHKAYTRRISKESNYYMDRTDETMNWRGELKQLFDEAVKKGYIEETGHILFDGEAAHHDSSLGFINITSIEYRHKLSYFVYDLIEIKRSENGEMFNMASLPLCTREEYITNIFSGCSQTVVKKVPAYQTPEKFLKEFDWHLHLDTICERYIKDEYEGFMIKKKNGIYHFKRGDSWLKVKKLGYEDVAVVGFLYGKGKYTKTCGMLLIKSFDGVRSGTVGGMSDVERDKFRDYFKGIEGEAPQDAWFAAEIAFQEETSKSWRHPRFKETKQELKEPELKPF